MQNNSLTIRQARLQGQEGLWQITIEDGRFSRIDPQETASAPVGQVLDAECGLVIPPFIEPHIHLDTTQTAGDELEPVRHAFRGNRALGRTQGDAYPRRR